jgi:hypothetical protein
MTRTDSCPSLGRGVPRRLVAKRREIVKDVETDNAEQDYRVGAIAVATTNTGSTSKGCLVAFGGSELVELRCARIDHAAVLLLSEQRPLVLPDECLTLP